MQELRACGVGRTVITRRPRFPSTFPPPDARSHGTGRNRQGRRMTAEAVDRPSAHVRPDDGERMGMGRDPRGDGDPTCKIAGIAYTGSNPVPATLLLSCGNAAVGPQVRPGSTLRFPSAFPPPDAPPTPLACSAASPKRGPRSPRSAWCGLTCRFAPSSVCSQDDWNTQPVRTAVVPEAADGQSHRGTGLACRIVVALN
jgi:hypothetical protein